jgi:hypothetical protein
MKNIISIFVYTLTLTVFLTSCNSEKSLQKYYVEKQSNDNFIAIDLPASLISLNDNVSEESQETIKTLKKLNILAFKLNENNADAFKSESKEIKEVLSNKKFNDLMRGKHENISFAIKYLGDEDEIDEIVLFASESSKGFIVARILGDGMKPAQIMKLMKDVEKFDTDNPAFSQIGDLLGEMN